VLGGSLEVGQALAQPAEQASASTTPSAPSSSSASGSSSSTSSTAAGGTGTFAGATEETRFGPMQVEIVVKNGTITDVQALQLTNQDGRSVMISRSAAPILRQEALSALSANIDSVSGATYTSEGYIASLQSALDKAGLKR
jgi:uncharacterized protein with FMN-binding domain